jgi:hypothetical protein
VQALNQEDAVIVRLSHGVLHSPGSDTPFVKRMPIPLSNTLTQHVPRSILIIAEKSSLPLPLLAKIV